MLRIAIVGCGGAANGFHVPAWWSIDDVEMVAFCDLVKDKADRLAKKYHAKAYSNLSEMLSVESPDILDVVTLPEAHAECSITGLEAGCHVFCETSLATSTEEARRMVETAARCNRVLGHDCNYRFSPHHRMLKEWIDSGELGEPCYINSFGHASNYHHRTDLMHYFGGDVAEVYSLPCQHQNETLGHTAIFRFETGAVGSLFGTNLIAWDHPFIRIDYVGTKARVVTHDIVGPMDRFDLGVRQWKRWEPTVFEQRDFPLIFRLSIEAFANSIKNGTAPPVTGLDGLRYHQLRDAMSESIKLNAPVKPKFD